jgi:proton-dependent oligopeptide transporter, POT family
MSQASKKHPKALPFLFLSEMWERFGFYLMLGIFFLYMTDTEKGGMTMDNKTASAIFGAFIALVYLTPFIGELLADRVLGYNFFLVNFIIVLTTTIIILFMLKWLNKIVKEYGA